MYNNKLALLNKKNNELTNLIIYGLALLSFVTVLNKLGMTQLLCTWILEALGFNTENLPSVSALHRGYSRPMSVVHARTTTLIEIYGETFSKYDRWLNHAQRDIFLNFTKEFFEHDNSMQNCAPSNSLLEKRLQDTIIALCEPTNHTFVKTPYGILTFFPALRRPCWYMQMLAESLRNFTQTITKALPKNDADLSALISNTSIQIADKNSGAYIFRRISYLLEKPQLRDDCRVSETLTEALNVSAGALAEYVNTLKKVNPAFAVLLQILTLFCIEFIARFRNYTTRTMPKKLQEIIGVDIFNEGTSFDYAEEVIAYKSYCAATLFFIIFSSYISSLVGWGQYPHSPYSFVDDDCYGYGFAVLAFLVAKVNPELLKPFFHISAWLSQFFTQQQTKKHSNLFYLLKENFSLASIPIHWQQQYATESDGIRVSFGFHMNSTNENISLTREEIQRILFDRLRTEPFVQFQREGHYYSFKCLHGTTGGQIEAISTELEDLIVVTAAAKQDKQHTLPSAPTMRLNQEVDPEYEELVRRYLDDAQTVQESHRAPVTNVAVEKDTPIKRSVRARLRYVITPERKAEILQALQKSTTAKPNSEQTKTIYQWSLPNYLQHFSSLPIINSAQVEVCIKTNNPSYYAMIVDKIFPDNKAAETALTGFDIKNAQRLLDKRWGQPTGITELTNAKTKKGSNIFELKYGDPHFRLYGVSIASGHQRELLIVFCIIAESLHDGHALSTQRLGRIKTLMAQI